MSWEGVAKGLVKIAQLADGRVAVVDAATDEPVQYVTNDASGPGLLAQWQSYFENAIARVGRPRHAR